MAIVDVLAIQTAFSLISISDRKTIFAFVSTYIIFLIAYVEIFYNSGETSLAYFGTLVTISSVWLTLYIAIWAYQVENQKKIQQEAENRYYKQNLIHDLHALLSVLLVSRTATASVFGLCADLQMLNLNSYVPPHIKTKVSMIIRTAQKAGMSEGIITNVAGRIDDLLETEYINQVKEEHVIRWIQEIRKSTSQIKK